MSPNRTSKKGHHVVNGAVRELQALLDSAAVRVEERDDSACQIPWRTSRRLQEATLRNLTKERDADGSLPAAVCGSPVVKKEKESPESSLTTRPPPVKRQRSPSSPTTPFDLVNSDDSDDADASGESCGNQDTPKVGIVVDSANGLAQISCRKRKRRSVHFADPLFFVIEDRKQQQQQLSVESARRANTSAARKSSTGLQHIKLEDAGMKTPKLGSRQHPPSKQPMSCFDLLCNFSGTRGWRCYRHCVEGESFCSYHLSSQKSNASPSIVRISLCT